MVMDNSKITSKKTTERGKGKKGRKPSTNQNKLRNLKSFYERTYKHSEEVKKSNKYPNKTKYFCDRFPNLESFLKVNPIKEVNYSKR